MEIAVTLLIMVICLCAEAFFTGSEIGIVSADRIKLRHDASKGSRGAKLALDMLKHPEWLLSTTLVGTNISVVANTTIATALVIELLGEHYSWLAVVIVAPLIWVFGEIVPKSVFQQRADTITPRAIFVLRGASYLFFPILIFFSVLTRFLMRILGSAEGRNPFTLREEIVAMMSMRSLGTDIEPMEKTMIRRVFDFGETTVRDVMVPIGEVVGIERSATCGEATRLASDSAYKRLTVYDKSVDKIVGTVNSLDLLLVDDRQPITAFINKPVRVSGSRSIANLLTDIRNSGRAMVVVVDEAGGTEGIVTLEDILEVVVGEIEDEYDAEEEEVEEYWVRKIGEQEFLFDARVEMEIVEEEVGLNLADGEEQTLANFLLEIAQEAPASGTVIEHQGITFTVRQATADTIQEVHVTW